jgi:hypothetical protein
MAVKYCQLVTPQPITSAAASYYTVPAQRKTLITRMTLSSSAASTVVCEIHVLPSGGTLRKVVPDIPIPAGKSDTVPDIEGHILNAGDQLYFLGSSDIIAFASGVEV